MTPYHRLRFYGALFWLVIIGAGVAWLVREGVRWIVGWL